MKNIYTLEYDLNNASHNLLWDTIGAPLGLAEWFSDVVTVEGNKFTFTWEDNSEQIAILQQIKPGKFIRFQWETDENTPYYFQMEIVPFNLSNELHLLITDFAEDEEKEDEILLWNNAIETLKRKIGL